LTLTTATPSPSTLPDASERRSTIIISQPTALKTAYRGYTVRRKQTALLITMLLLSSLAFISQTRPQSSVSSTDPITADRGGPPVTDEDGDRIPDLHESIFGNVRFVESSTGVVSVNGLNPMNATDNMSDHDNDGASALLEFCWPYTLDTCFDRLSLTGKPPQFTESGLREYLDPRVADTDGDGLPDGYEIYI